MIRKSIDDPWKEVTMEEAINYAASELKRLQEKHGRNSVGGITSSRCTNEETYLVQKLVRAAFGNNNVDTCARVCHSPTGYGLKATLGESSGTQDFDSIKETDVAVIIGANPTDGHPVFASHMKRRLRDGMKLIVIDPREIDILHTVHGNGGLHLQLKPGTNVAMITSIAHVIVTEGRCQEQYINDRCELDSYEMWKEFVSRKENSPEVLGLETGVDPKLIREAARMYAEPGNSAFYYGLGVTEHSQGTTMVMGIANLAMATGNLGKNGAGVNPLRGQNNVQGACDMGSFPHEFPGYRHVSDQATRDLFGNHWGVKLDHEPGLRIPNMLDFAIDGMFKGIYIEGEDIAQSDPNTKHVTHALKEMECVIVQDLFLNETAMYAHVFLPGSSFLEKSGTFTNAERRISPVRRVMAPKNGYEDWEITQMLSNALGYKMEYSSASEILDEIAELTPTFKGVSWAKLKELGSIQWPCDDANPTGTPIMHVNEFVRGKGKFWITEYIPTDEKVNGRFPLILTTGRILSHYNVGAQTRRTKNSEWHKQDLLEIHPTDAEARGINDGDLVNIKSRAGHTSLSCRITERVQPGVVYTTFHHPWSGANVITTENSDWATNCPEFKVTAVEISLAVEHSEWQKQYEKFSDTQKTLVEQFSL